MILFIVHTIRATVQVIQSLHNHLSKPRTAFSDTASKNYSVDPSLASLNFNQYDPKNPRILSRNSSTARVGSAVGGFVARISEKSVVPFSLPRRSDTSVRYLGSTVLDLEPPGRPSNGVKPILRKWHHQYHQLICVQNFDITAATTHFVMDFAASGPMSRPPPTTTNRPSFIVYTV